MVQSTEVITAEMKKQFSDPEEDIMFQENITKISTWGWSQQRSLAVTIDHVYVFTGNKLSRKHRITNLGAIIQSKVSSEIVLHFPNMKDLRITGLSKARQQELIHLVQLRYVSKLPENTLELYGVDNKHLKEYARDNSKYGFSNLPPIEFRQRDKEIKGSKDDFEAQKKAVEKEIVKVVESKDTPVSTTALDMDFDENRFSMKQLISTSDSTASDLISSTDSEANFKHEMKDFRGSMMVHRRLRHHQPTWQRNLRPCVPRRAQTKDRNEVLRYQSHQKGRAD